MKCINVHDCLEGEKTLDNKKQVKVHFLVMHCDLNHCHDHKKSCGSYSTVIVLCVERDWIQVCPLGSVECFDCESTFTSKITLYCHSKSNYPHP